MAEQVDKAKKVSFKETLNLPKTEFPLRANAVVNDPIMIKRWEKENVFKKSFEYNAGKEKYILHDGPPYANGHIHLGTAYNKILKDIIAKSQRMMGKHVPVTPGWDCHGLPIELKVTKDTPGLEPKELKERCRAYAQHWVNVQRHEFKELGVLMDWDDPYLTMAPEYEASIIRAFGEFVDQGYIERKNKTVPWCSSCKTVLATAEIEYYDRKDPSIYVLFALEQQAIDIVLPTLKGKVVYALIWTTTPWTLPLNRAVLLKPKSTYAILKINDRYIAVGKELVAKIVHMLKIENKVIAEFISDDLVMQQAQAYHPFVDELTVPLILDHGVALDEGTAFVHCAPGCGPQDYDIGVQHKLEIFSPVGPSGYYQEGIFPAELEGMSIVDAAGWVITKLKEKNALLHKSSIVHSYPHCWRCRNGLIFRATKQWFCDLSKNNLKENALKAINGITMLPKKSKNRLLATVEGRLEWCLSRQRVWGIPITAVLCMQCDYTYINKELIKKVAQEIAKKGIEYWDIVDVKQLLPKNFTCPDCQSAEFKKEVDILDVWFDSGVSHYAVLAKKTSLGFPATIYQEGKDQHRGWFQSSLFTSMVLHGKAPMEIILTHGYTVDKDGRKMSKSLGNVVAPQDMIKKMGTDGLRLWAASVDYGGDLLVSDVVVDNVIQVGRKIRNTCRFLLSNLYDFNIKKDALPLDQLLPIDQYALQQLFEVQQSIRAFYEEYNLSAVFHELADYCTVSLSSFYLDIVKDRLYVEKSDGELRRSTQTACWYILDTLTRLMAPVMSFTAESVSDHYQQDK